MSNQLLIRISIDFQGYDRGTESIYLSRVPCVGEYICLQDETTWFVASVMHEQTLISKDNWKEVNNAHLRLVQP